LWAKKVNRDPVFIKNVILSLNQINSINLARHSFKCTTFAQCWKQWNPCMIILLYSCYTVLYYQPYTISLFIPPLFYDLLFFQMQYLLLFCHVAPNIWKGKTTKMNATSAFTWKIIHTSYMSNIRQHWDTQKHSKNIRHEGPYSDQ